MFLTSTHWRLVYNWQPTVPRIAKSDFIADIVCVIWVTRLRMSTQLGHGLEDISEL